MKKIILLIFLMFIFVGITNAQFKIGSVKLADSSGTLVIQAPISTWSDGWIKLAMLPATLAGNGLGYNTTDGLTINVGSGLVIEHDTLIYNGSEIVTVDDSTIYYGVDGKLRVRYNDAYGITQGIDGIRLNVGTNSGLTFSSNELTLSVDSGLVLDGGSIKINTDNNVLGFTSGGLLQINANSITESEISEDLNLDSIKIGGMTMKLDDGKLTIDSININGLIKFQKRGDGLSFLVSGNENAYFKSSSLTTGMFLGVESEESLYIISGSQANWTDSMIASFSWDAINMNRRLTTAQSDTDDIGLDSVITISNGNFIIVTNTATQELNYITTTGWTPGSIVIIRSGSDAFTINHGKSDAPANTLPIYTRDGNRIDFEAEGQTVMLVYDGVGWREVSRGVASP